MTKRASTRNPGYLFIPILGVVLTIFVVGFTYTVYVATEYGKHSQELRIIDAIGRMNSIFRQHHQSLISGEIVAGDPIRLDQNNSSILVGMIDALTLDMGKAVIVASYGDATQLYYKGHTLAQAQELERFLRSNNLDAAYQTFQNERALIETATFSSNPPGRFWIAATTKPGVFVIDFVFFKLWPVLLIAVLVSFAIAGVAYRFVRNRHAEVMAERGRLNDFAESSSDWFWEMDENLRFSYFSSKFTEVTGVPESLLLGATREENGNPGAKDEDWEQHLNNLHAHRSFRNFVHSRVKPDGSIVWLAISGKPVFENDRFIGFRGTGTDITQQRVIATQLSKLKEEAEDANHAKTKFLANMSHELRTPLNAIVGFSDAIIQETFGPVGNPRIKEAINSINSAGLHLAQIIGDILDISKIEASVITLDEEEIDLIKLATDAVSLLTPNAEDHGVELATEFLEYLPAMRGDRLRIKQVALNLLNNAIKFTPTKGRVILSLTLQPDNGISLKISDTGIGIKPEDIPKVVAPFAQVADAQRRNHHGTGLGLPICKALVELHGGNLTIESEIGCGTTVVVNFPPDRTILS